MPNNSLNDYAVLITGGTTGLGLSHARVLGMRGAKVAITDFNQGNLDQAKAALKGDGIAALCLKADNRVVAEVKAAVATAEAEFGKLDVLVNNAGITGMMAPIEHVDEAFFDSLFDTHVKGAFFAVQAAVPGMKKRQFGRIINTGSTFVMTGSPAFNAGESAAPRDQLLFSAGCRRPAPTHALSATQAAEPGDRGGGQCHFVGVGFPDRVLSDAPARNKPRARDASRP